MEYSEKEFRVLANRLALRIWVAITGILTIAYLIEVLGGKKTIGFYIIFLMLAWVPIITGLLVLKIKGKDSWILYDIFYLCHVYCGNGYYIQLHISGCRYVDTV